MRGPYSDKPYNALVVIGTTAKYKSVLSRFSLILSRVCLLGQQHIIYAVCCDALHLEKKNIFEIFLRHAFQPSVKANFNFNCP